MKTMSLVKFSLSLALFSAAAFAQECSTASLTGSYGYTINGTITNAADKLVTSSQVGRITFDGKGAYSGVGVSTSGAKAEIGEFTGVIQIGSDCTAVAKTGIGADATNFDLVVVNNGSDFAIVVRAGDATLAGSGSKIEGQGTCSPASLTGTFGYQGEGVVAVDGKGKSTAEIGILTFDGKGEVKGTFSAISGGQSVRQSFTGVYALGDICYGSAAYNVGGSDYEMNFMVVNSGNQILYSELSSGYVVTGAGVRTVVK